MLHYLYLIKDFDEITQDVLVEWYRNMSVGVGGYVAG